MKKLALPLALLLALLFVGTAGATGDVCPSGGGWVKVDGLSGKTYTYTAPAGAQIVEVCYKHATFTHTFSINPVTSYTVTADFHGDRQPDLSHASFRLERLPTPTPEPTPEPIRLRLNCTGWGLMRGDELIDSGEWTKPFELETATSQFVDYLIREPEECLKERGDPTLRIGGRCTEDGDSQEIGYVFDDGDYDDARLRITRQDGVVVLEGAPEGSDFFPARATGYSWQIIWFDGETRVVLDEGRFEVPKCDLPTPTPKPTEPPPTGGSGAFLDDPVFVVGMGFAALLAVLMGALKLWERRRGI
jgi:hypothetical protein